MTDPTGSHGLGYMVLSIDKIIAMRLLQISY